MLLKLKMWAYFLLSIWDMKHDFPVPPKFPSRMLQPSFWGTMVELYAKRKRHARRQSSITRASKAGGVKDFWIETPFTRPSYSQWVHASLSKQWGTVVDEGAFTEMTAPGVKRILEAGCGAGQAAICLLTYAIQERSRSSSPAAPPLEYIGVDLSEARVAVARDYVPLFIRGHEDKFRLRFDVGDLEKLRFEDRYFDYTFVPSVLERVDDKAIGAVVGELSRVTRNRIFITDFFDHYPDGWPRDHDELGRLFAPLGFAVAWHRYVLTDTRRNQCELHLMLERHG